MCLGVPARVLELRDNQLAVVDVRGNQVKVSIALTPEVEEGQHVLVHAGFAMEIIAEEEAMKTMALLEELIENGEMPSDEH